MYQSIRLRIRLSVSLVLLTLFWVRSVLPAEQDTISEQAASVNERTAQVGVVLGLANVLNADVKKAAKTELAELDTSIVDLDSVDVAAIEWPDSGIVVAVGVSGCQSSVENLKYVPVLCVLLTEENFRQIQDEYPEYEKLSAIVIDQPLSRQALVAHRIYPALSRFAVLSNTQTDMEKQSALSIDVQPFRLQVPLAPQLTEAIVENDALIALPEQDIYNRSTVHTVLLTAYGYGKPVIGMSRSYVKAGALITSYSSPSQVFRQVAESLMQVDRNAVGYPRIEFPRYFSVVDNFNVAKSLGLTKFFDFELGHTYTDGDFQP